MQISVKRQLLIPETGLTQTIETIGKGISAEHAFEDARTKLDAIEKRFYSVELYRSNLKLIKRHESGELLNETELETTKNQIAEFEAAEKEFAAKQGKSGEAIEVDLPAIITVALALMKTLIIASNEKKPSAKKPAKKAATKKPTAKKAGGKK